MPPRPPVDHEPSPLQRALPNALTTLRLVAAGVFVWLLSSTTPIEPRILLVAASLFIAAALTDALDGYLARRWNATSRFGRIADPLADKLLVLGAFVCLAGPGFTALDEAGRYQASAISPLIAMIIVARELVVTSLRGLIEGAGGDFSASFSGKAKMILQSIVVPAILLTLALADVDRHSTTHTLLGIAAWLTAVVTALSAWPYIARALQPPPAPPSSPEQHPPGDGDPTPH